VGNRVGVVGIGQTKYTGRHNDVNVPELAQQAVIAALSDAEMKIEDIDAVVFGIAPESFEGVNCPDKWCVDAVGMLQKPTLRVHTGGTTGGAAAHAAVELVASGTFNKILVVALQRVGQSPDAQRILNTIWDPVYEKDFALGTIALAGLRSARLMKLHGITERHWAKVSVKNHRWGLKNPYAHVRIDVTEEDVMNSRVLCSPIKLLDACPRSEGACAIILASEDYAKKIAPKPAWFQGIGAASDTYFIGDRLGDPVYDFVDAGALTQAAQKAYMQAGISDPLHQLDVLELYGPFTSSETQAYEALGLCGRGQAAAFIEKGIGEEGSQLPINPSGGVQCANPIGATGLIRIAEIALQIMGKAGEHQIPDVHRGLATAAGGSSQFFAVSILGDKPI
jgi:acetyl-CoA C-acetyltransferase